MIDFQLFIHRGKFIFVAPIFFHLKDVRIRHCATGTVEASNFGSENPMTKCFLSGILTFKTNEKKGTQCVSNHAGRMNALCSLFGNNFSKIPSSTAPAAVEMTADAGV